MVEPKNALEQEIYNSLKSVIDPELGMNIVDLGMVKKLSVGNEGDCEIEIGLTIEGCPLRTQIQGDVRTKLLSLSAIRSVKVNFSTLSKEEKAKLMAQFRKSIVEKSPGVNLEGEPEILAVASGKGGVGKSTVSVNLAVGLSLEGYSVGLLDADIGGFSVPRLLGLGGEIGVSNKKMLPPEIRFGAGSLKCLSMGFLARENSALMWRGLLLAKAFQQFLEDANWGYLDYLIIDMPPGTSDIQLSLPKLLPRSGVVVITTPHKGAQMVASRIADLVQKSYLRLIGVIENMSYFVCAHGETYHIFGEGSGEDLANSFGVPLIGKVPLDERLAKSTDEGKPIVLDNDSKTGNSFREICELIKTKYLSRREMSLCSARQESKKARSKLVVNPR